MQSFLLACKNVHTPHYFVFLWFRLDERSRNHVYGVHAEARKKRVDNLFTGLRRRTPVSAYGQQTGKLDEMSTVPVRNLLS